MSKDKNNRRPIADAALGAAVAEVSPVIDAGTVDTGVAVVATMGPVDDAEPVRSDEIADLERRVERDRLRLEVLHLTAERDALTAAITAGRQLVEILQRDEATSRANIEQLNAERRKTLGKSPLDRALASRGPSRPKFPGVAVRR